jgi:CheY-like chemotaxis protein
MSKVSCPIEILLIEDNPGDAKLFQKCFKRDRRPTNVHMVFDGEEALHFLNRTGAYASAIRPDIIVMDLNLPKIDGKELLRLIKSDVALKTIPIIILTSSDSSEDVRQSYEYGANCVLIKGTDFESVTNLFHMVEAFWVNLVSLPPAR